MQFSKFSNLGPCVAGHLAIQPHMIVEIVQSGMNTSFEAITPYILFIVQGMTFVILMNPVFFFCEKAVGVHTKSIFIRFLVRIPVVAFHWFLALAIPFFGPINSVIGALLITVGVYIIPLAAFNYLYHTKAARQVFPNSLSTLEWGSRSSVRI